MTSPLQTLTLNEGLRLSSPSGEREASLFVRQGFAAAAPFYDALTRFFSFGLDGRWRRRCLEACQLKASDLLLDVATGTGEMAIEGASSVLPAGRVVGLDSCWEMLSEAQRKIGRPAERMAWVQGRAESLPFKEKQFDCLTVGFALRHVTDLVGTLKEMVRVLKPGGRLGIVEFTRPERAIRRFLLLGYLSVVIPPLVGLLSRSWPTFQLARYLPATIKGFVSTEGLCRSLETTGLDPVAIQRYMGGMVSVCVAVKANEPRSTLTKGLG